MKKTSKSLQIVWLLGMVVGFTLIDARLAAAQVAPQERTTGFSKGFALGLVRCSDSNFGTGFTGRGFVEYAPFIHEIAFRLSAGYFRFDDTVELGQDPFSFRKRNLSFTSFYLTGGAIYRFSRGKIVPFLAANAGVYRSDKETVLPAAGVIIGGEQMSPYNTVELVESYDFGANLGGGVEYFLSENTSIGLETLAHAIFGNIDTRIFDVTVMFRFFPGKQ